MTAENEHGAPQFNEEDQANRLLDDLTRALIDGDDPGPFMALLAEPWRSEAEALVSGCREIGGLIHPVVEHALVGLDRYTIVQRLGEGGQATVYLAIDHRLNRQVAIKVLRAATVVSDRARARFVREAEVASKLVHPGICTIHDFGTHLGTPYIVLEFVRGASLGEWVDQLKGLRDGGSVEDPAATEARIRFTVRLVEEVSRVLHYAHEHGHVHRDIKPGNVMLGPDEHPVVCDFGLATDCEQIDAWLTETGEVIGTPAYMAPEQIRGGPDASDRRVDVYALGVTLYECLTLERPFVARSRAGLYEAILKSTPADPRRLVRGVSRDLAATVARAMARDPRERYQTALELAEDLERVRHEIPTAGRPARVFRRFGRWCRHHRGRALTAGGLLVASAVALALCLLGDGAPTPDVDDPEPPRRLADRLVAAQVEAEGLWPARAERLAVLRDWVAKYSDLAALLPDRKARVAALRRRAIQPEGALVNGRRKWTFKSAATEAEHDELARVVAGLEAFCAPRGPLASVRDRIVRAQSIETETVGAHAAAWSAARQRIIENRVYGGLEIAPIVGLVPLGPDPSSRLEEFLHYESHAGDPPDRDAEGQLARTSRTGIVLTLLPGGDFLMGAQSQDAAAPNFDAHSILDGPDDEGPVHQVVLAAFLMSKFEMTQGQWVNLTGQNPASLRARDGLTRPVETVSWEDCHRVLKRVGLAVPTEAQWEYAARAGSTTAWITGARAESLAGFVNLSDAKSNQRLAARRWRYESFLKDGFLHHAPVGTFGANGWGLHDCTGNVQELCRDQAGAYENPVRPGDGLRLETTSSYLRYRGGAFVNTREGARCAKRHRIAPTFRSNSLGIRPSAALPR